MDDKEEIQSTSRHRSPTFNKQEIERLLELVEKYRIYVLNKSITSAASQAKESAWVKIARHFNNSAFGRTRSPENLRLKWENLKRDARKVRKNILDTSKGDLDFTTARIVQLLNAMEHIGSIDAPEEMSETEMESTENEPEEQKDASESFPKFWNDSQESNDGDQQIEKNGRHLRSQNFSPEECKLLLQCVRKEKQHVFCKDITGKAIEMKNRAWSRIADSYNKLSPQKRSSKMLRTKFMSMKKMAKKVGTNVHTNVASWKAGKHEKFGGDGFKNIKKEPLHEEGQEDSDQCSEGDDPDNNAPEDDGLGRCIEVEVGRNNDPLSSVLNGDSGIGSNSMNWNWSQSESKEVNKLKLELLNYQLETAKLERKRLEDAMIEEERARLAKDTERSLRLRAARLEAIAAELRLPPNHAALHFPSEETAAHNYLTRTQYHHT